MSVPAVHWHEGMFLRPHHFQAADRYWADQVRANGRFDVHYNWGVRAIDIDPDALKNYRFEVHRLEARLRDGTVVAADRDHPIPGLDLRPAFERLPLGDRLDIVLGVPVVQLGRENAAAAAGGGAVRYAIDAPREPVPDENTGQNPRLVQYRRLTPRLYTAGSAEADGQEVLTVARLERSVQVAAPPQLAPDYIPPALACDAWPALGDGVIGQVYNQVGTLVKQLAQRAESQQLSLYSNNPDDRKIVERLRALNEGYAAFGVVARAAGVHPFPAYLELCRLAGKLAVFGRSPALADDALPPYDHDDLGGCFFAAKRLLDELLSYDFKTGYQERKFVGDGNRLRVGIEPAWLAPAAVVLVGVKSEGLKREACVRLLTGSLNMKIGAFERVDEVFLKGHKGLEFVPEAEPPRVLPPATDDMCYFKVKREASAVEWKAVADSYTLAIRMNDKLISGTIDGKHEVAIKQEGGKVTTLRFTLFVVPPA